MSELAGPGWLKPGAHVYVHGVNDDYVGEVVALLPGRVIALRNASWVADSGQYLSTFIAEGRTKEGMEIEPVGDHVMHWEGVTRWPHKLFTERYPK